MDSIDRVAAVNTPGAHYIDGDGEEWVVGPNGTDYPATVDYGLDPHGTPIREDSECYCTHGLADHSPDSGADYSRSALCLVCEDNGWECDFFEVMTPLTSVPVISL